MNNNLKSYVSNGDSEVQFGRFRTIFFYNLALVQEYISRLCDFCVVSDESLFENVFYKITADGLTSKD